VILGTFWSRNDLRQRRNRKFLGDDQGCLSEQTVGRGTCESKHRWRKVVSGGFERKGDRVLVYNIFVVLNRRYGLKRRSGMLELILDLNVGSVQ
jgi:hypothetical protein